ncbi:MAG: Rpn family recombination-promoting nuclease/putative transposase [Peptococcaceae bacterium]|nr:Rpn family recombination-promoting nuclease/putative transposase [Peptococcaceae bacterium]MBQ5652787.1 Rpn family recombination-promoting nuclease/putative transposase [Peptococcaceae bacterium]
MTENANRNYRDSVFSKYFQENPEGLVEIYNAIAGTDYPLDTPIMIDTLDEVLYKEKINDLSFVLDEQILVLIEHQYTINENMALRLLMYVARLYEKLLNQWEKRAIYEEKRIPIPTPEFVVLYNGKEPQPEHTVQYLSEAFMLKKEYPALELKVDVYNINYGETSELLQKSQHLTNYSLFVHLVNQGRTGGKPLAKAIRDAIRYCIEHDIMRKFLEENGSEVQNMLMQEWKLEDALNYKEKKGREEGEKIGEQKEREKTIRALKDVLEPEVIAETLKQPVEYVLKVLDDAAYVCEDTVPYRAEKKE